MSTFEKDFGEKTKREEIELILASLERDEAVPADVCEELRGMIVDLEVDAESSGYMKGYAAGASFEQDGGE